MLSYLYFFPWSVDRTSIGAQLAAVFRACWLFCALVVLILVTGNPSYLLYLLSFLCLLTSQNLFSYMSSPIFSVVKQKQKFLVFGILAMLVASLRSSASFHQLLSYGIVGEAYNATKALGLLYNIPFNHFPLLILFIFSYNHLLLFLGYFAFFTNTIKLLSSPLDVFVSSHSISNLSPMGGWY